MSGIIPPQDLTQRKLRALRAKTSAIAIVCLAAGFVVRMLWVG